MIPQTIQRNRDLAGDLYHIPDPDGLDRKSAKLLWSYRG